MAAEQTKKGGKFLILFSLTELQSKHVRPLATNADGYMTSAGLETTKVSNYDEVNRQYKT